MEMKFSHFSLIFQIESNDAHLKEAEKARIDAEQRLEDSRSTEVSLREEYRSEVSVYHGFFLGLCFLAECLCLGFGSRFMPLWNRTSMLCLFSCGSIKLILL